MKKTTSNTLGGRLKTLRAATTLSQEQLAQRLFLSRSCIANYEADKRHPSIDMIERISDYFKVSPSYLMGETDAKFNIDNSEIKNYNYLKYLSKDEKLDISELSPYYKIALIEYFLFLIDKQ